MSDVAVAERANVSIERYRPLMKPTCLVITEQLPIDEWLEVVEMLGSMKDSTSWWIGDALEYGELAYGERHAQALNISGLSYQTVRNLKSVSHRVPREIRREALSWGHHEAVAWMDPTDQEVWLEAAESESLTRDDFRARIKSGSPAKPSMSQPQWSPPTPVVEGEVTNGISVQTVRDALVEAIELAETPLVDLEPAKLQEHKERFERVLNTVENAQRVVFEEAGGSVGPLKVVAERARDVVDSRGKSGLRELREALTEAGYIGSVPG